MTPVGKPPLQFGAYEARRVFHWATLAVTGLMTVLMGILWFLLTYEFPWMHSAGGYFDAAATLATPVCIMLYQFLSDNRGKQIRQ